jgi:flagellar hook assembly protein FlgD
VLDFALAREGAARLAVYDAGGRMVRLLFDGSAIAGSHRALWDGRDEGGRPLPTGIYFTRLSLPGRELSARVLRIR